LKARLDGESARKPQRRKRGPTVAAGALRPPSFIFKSHAETSWFEATILSQFPWLAHAFSTRAPGNFPPSKTAGHTGFSSDAAFHDEPERAFLKDLHPGDFDVASVRQVHSADVVCVRRKTGRLEYSALGPAGEQASSFHRLPADALMTNESGVLLAIRTADCLPVLMADTRGRVVAAIHAGWRGALKGIIGKTVGEMQRVFRCAPEELVVALGPSIRSCCYVVGQEVVDAFCREFNRAEKKFFREGTKETAAGSIPAAGLGSPARTDPSAHSPSHLDLVAVALDQLASAGVPSSHIEVSDLCTACRADLFYSYRKEGVATGRMLAVLGMRQDSASGVEIPQCG
jgi:polyphenol oxidase